MFRSLVVIASLVVSSLLIVGCGAPSLDLSTYVYPPPPDTARIKLVEIARGREDYGRSFMQVLLGSGKGDALVQPSGVAFDTAGNLVVIDPMAGGVVVFDKLNGTVRTFDESHMKLPLNCAIDSKNLLYVTDPRCHQVLVYTIDGTYVRSIGRPEEFNNLAAIAIDEPRDRIYLTDSHKHCVMVHTMAGDSIATIGTRGDSVVQFNFPTSITVDKKGNFYVVDALNFRIQVFDSTLKFIRAFGRNGDSYGEFARPRGIALDQDQHIYVGDVQFNNFQVFGPEGKLRTFIGGAGFQPGQFNSPAGMAFDGKDRIAVVDQGNRRVQVFQYLGQPK